MFEEKLKQRLLEVLKPGDLLFYSSNGLFGRMIKLKTSSKVSHVATYVGNGKIREAKEGIGVHGGWIQLNNLVLVRRPLTPYDLKATTEWFLTVNGQGYDYIGLILGFVARKWGRTNNRMWCSEFCTRDARIGGVEPFDPSTDADAIHPGHLAFSAAYRDLIKVDRKNEVWHERLAEVGDPNWAGAIDKVGSEMAPKG